MGEAGEFVSPFCFLWDLWKVVPYTMAVLDPEEQGTDSSWDSGAGATLTHVFQESCAAGGMQGGDLWLLMALNLVC